MIDSKKETFFIIFSLWLLVFAASSQIMIIAPILPRISEQLAVSEALLGTLVTAYAVMVGLCALITGPISDKIGRRKILLIGTGMMAAALLLHGLITNYLSFLIVRGLAGAAGGILSGSSVSYVGDYFPYHRRGWANGWIMSGIAMGQILGIPIGTVLAEYMGFRAPFLAFAGLMIVTFLLIWLTVPQPDVKLQRARITALGAIRKYLLMLQKPAILAAAGSYFLMFLSISVYVIFLPTWLETTFAVSGNEIATLFFAGGIANVMTGPQAGKLSDKWGRKSIIIFSCLGLALVMIFTTFLVQSFWLAYPLFFVTMMLVAMRISPFQALTTELVSAGKRGTLMSLLVAIGQVGYGLGGSIAGPAYVWKGYFSNTLIGAVMIFGMAFLVWRYLPEPELEETGS
ncbi:MFS transporter [Aliifodinibius salicampi]|uniref:MFS transporter n=1 Tax=Fodinibius salicampi TaxID=1920655 RepID=A0ABT3Q0E3_9BACT|nr:MFS transporter [Fodinibius salicampi]MCW9713523.1 MFS transporter [Fodinibius salicampi]